MKNFKFFVIFLLVFSVITAFAKNKKPNDSVLISHTQDQTVLQFEITSYDFQEVQTPNGIEARLVAPNTSEILEKGAPALRKLSAAVIVPDKMEMQVNVLNSTFVEIENVALAPSKGNLLRTVNPDDVPYEYGREYQTNAFYPANLVDLTEPYITRDYRGQAVIAYPFRYNPVTKVLRVYTRLKVKVFPTGNRGKNTLERRPHQKITREFKNVYARHYLNYKQVAESQASVQYTPLPDDIGNMLIICYNGFMSEMNAFVSWKQNIGYTVNLVDYSTIGSSAALKTYVENYYNTNGLTFLLLVGDHAQVPTSSTTAGDSDNNYGYIVGSDHYLDIFVGRFSAETSAHVTTQVDRTIHYERDVLPSAGFFSHATGMGSSEGPGHNGEYDYQHINLILSDLTGYGYTTDTNHQSGGSTSNLANLINNGTGTMFYCGHGSTTCWTCGWTFCNSNVDVLVNENELPFIFSVACVVGNFKNTTCFCESWLRATNNGNPTGAVAHAGSTINQSWVPPMDAQDEFADLMVSVSGPKRTFGGVFVNGLFKMIDINGASGESMADTWTCFGDPSVQLRTPGTPDGPIPGPPEPPVADFSADPTTVCVGGIVNFTDLSTNCPTSWNWTFEGGTPSSSTVKNPTVTYNTPGTYTVTLTVCNAQGCDTEAKVDYITVIENCYCPSSAIDQSFEYIAGVEVGDLNNPSGPSPYSDFTSLVAHLIPGATVNVSLTPGFPTGSSFTENWKIWIDYNIDGDFEDLGEEVFSGASSSTVNGSFTVPLSASGTTRMRVSMKYGGYPTPCETFTYGEVEDYTVNITNINPAEPDFNNDGKADIIWRYYGTGGYNAVWLRGTATTTASASAAGISSDKNNMSFVDMENAEVKGEKGKVVDNTDMNISIQELRKQGIIDGFEGYTPPVEEEGANDPFENESSQGVSRTMAIVSDPRDDPEAVELPAAADTQWKLCGAGDFNGDAKPDLVWRHVGNGENAVWFMDGVTRTGVGWFPAAANLDWTLCGTGDFNNDGKPDLVWRHVGNGSNAVWFMDGLTRTGVGWLPTAVNLDWTLCGTGDFNNDGNTDLVWRHVGNGDNAVWFMDGVIRTGVGWFPPAANLDWTLCGTGDFNNDGKMDLLW
ncbi:MAG: FG-GAP repeat protein, partial [Candidatus Aminicenantes bacterium]